MYESVPNTQFVKVTGRGRLSRSEVMSKSLYCQARTIVNLFGIGLNQPVRFDIVQILHF